MLSAAGFCSRSVRLRLRSFIKLKLLLAINRNHTRQNGNSPGNCHIQIGLTTKKYDVVRLVNFHINFILHRGVYFGTSSYTLAIYYHINIYFRSGVDRSSWWF